MSVSERVRVARYLWYYAAPIGMKLDILNQSYYGSWLTEGIEQDWGNAVILPSEIWAIKSGRRYWDLFSLAGPLEGAQVLENN